MNKYVLFTCVGSTDPIRDNYDGGMLHIIRHYKPHTVYVFFSDEMGRREKLDTRFSRAVEMLAEFLGVQIKVEKIFSDIKDAHNFDAYMHIFREILLDIRAKFTEDTIIINLSSGTPQMKTTMCIEAIFTPGSVLPMQVSSPAGRSNISKVVGDQYDVELEFRNNLDNEPDAPNRCFRPDIMSVRKAMAKSQLIALVKSYNYSAAKIFVNDFYPEVGKKVLQLLEHAVLRLDLQEASAMKAVSEIDDVDFYPVKDRACGRICEYLNMLDIYCRKGDISGFLLRLNPLIVELQAEFLKKEFKIDVYGLTEKKPLGETVVRVGKIKDFDARMLEYISENHYKGEFKDGSPFNIRFQNAVIDYCIKIKGGGSFKYWQEFFKNLEKLNYEYRNPLAHELFGVTEKEVHELSGMTAMKIVKTLKTLIRKIYQNCCKEEIFDIYEIINEKIINYIQ